MFSGLAFVEVNNLSTTLHSIQCLVPLQALADRRMMLLLLSQSLCLAVCETQPITHTVSLSHTHRQTRLPVRMLIFFCYCTFIQNWIFFFGKNIHLPPLIVKTITRY